MDYHELRPCVYEKVNHINILLKKNRGDSDSKAWANFHVGSYRNSTGGLCFVIFEQVSGSNNMRICWKPCGPSRLDLQNALNQAMTSILASMGIRISAYAIATAAITLSYLIYPVLIAI